MSELESKIPERQRVDGGPVNARSRRSPTPQETAPRRSAVGGPRHETRDPRFAELDAQIARQEQVAASKPHKGRRKRRKERLRPNPIDPAIRASVQAAADHKRDYRPDRDLAERMAKAYRAALIPHQKPGVKPKPETVQAAELYLAGIKVISAGNQPVTPQALGKLWESIKRKVIPGWDNLAKYERKCRGDELRRNVRAYLKRRGNQLPLPIRPRAEK